MNPKVQKAIIIVLIVGMVVGLIVPVISLILNR